MTTGGSIWRGWKTGLLVGMATVGLVCVARAADPVVSGISASQRSGTKFVDITYNLSADANCTVSVQVYTNNGSTYNLPASSFSGSGYGSGVTPGTGKEIVWDAGADWGGNYSEQVWFKITADDNAGSYMIIDLTEGQTAINYPVSYTNAIPSGGWTDEYKTTKIVLRKIPAGTFTMGSPSGELGRGSDETQHQVTLTKDFYVGVFQVTQKQWELVMGNWPSYFTNTTYRDSRPVEQVSYFDIRENPANSAISPNWPDSSQVHADSFMGKLRAKTGLATLDLPTESQWEYAGTP